MVTPLARAAVAVGADGLIIEVHPCPEEALCDGAQALTPEQYVELVKQVREIYELLNPIARTNSHWEDEVMDRESDVLSRLARS